MTGFLDGPAKDQTLCLRRCPLFLRVTSRRKRDGGATFDALDSLADAPADDEAIYTYRRVGGVGSVHLDYTEKKTGRRKGVTYATGEYRIHEPQPPDEVMRDRDQWRQWCLAQVGIEDPG